MIHAKYSIGIFIYWGNLAYLCRGTKQECCFGVLCHNAVMYLSFLRIFPAARASQKCIAFPQFKKQNKAKQQTKAHWSAAFVFCVKNVHSVAVPFCPWLHSLHYLGAGLSLHPFLPCSLLFFLVRVLRGGWESHCAKKHMCSGQFLKNNYNMDVWSP